MKCSTTHRVASIRSKVLFAIGCVLMANTLPTSATSPLSPRAWEGVLTVHEQEGPACSQQPAPPHQLKVHVFGRLDAELSGRLLFTGETQGMEAYGDAGRLSLRVMPGIDAGVLGLSEQNGQLIGIWQEHAGTQPEECNWTQARIEMQLVLDQDTAIATGLQVEEAFELADRLERMPHTIAPQIPADALTRLHAIGERLADTQVQDLALARLYLHQAESALLSDRADASFALSATATRLHRLISAEYPELAADAYNRQAMVLRSRRLREEAETLYSEAMAILERSAKHETPLAGSIWNSLGVLYLRMERHDDAVTAFRKALVVNEDQDAPATRVAGIMNNLAHALHSGGYTNAALTVLDQAASRLSNGTPNERELATIIRESAKAMREEALPSAPQRMLNRPGFSGHLQAVHYGNHGGGYGQQEVHDRVQG